MDPTKRLQLNKMLQETNAVDNTAAIRERRHSAHIRRDIGIIMELLNQEPSLSEEEVDAIASQKCGFLFANYTDIYNRLRKRQIDPELLIKFIDALQDVEEGREDQHSASYAVGKILKELYVDSALRRQKDIDAKASSEESSVRPDSPLALSWKKYKLMQEDSTT